MSGARRFAVAGPGLAPGPAPLATVALAWCLLFWPTPPALAHGVEMSWGVGSAAWIRAGYAGGEPMEFAKVRVIAPDGRTHQVGNADAQGRFAWLAEQEGKWLVVAEDGVGHRGEVSLPWLTPTSAPAPPPPSPATDGPSQWPGLLWGLSVIFWLAGLAFWLGGRRARQGPRAGP